jgi:hypothetical protein
MAGLADIPRNLNGQADQALAADAALLDKAAQALRRPGSRGGRWRSLPRRGAASLADRAAGWLRRAQQAGHDDPGSQLPDLLE